MVHGQAFDLMKRYEHTSEEELVFLLEWQSKTVDDGAQDLEQLGNAIETFGLVDELEKDVVDGAANIGPKIEEFAVDAMKSSLQKVPLPWIFGIKQLEELQDEAVVDVLLCVVCVEVGAFDEAQKKLINNLNVWPGYFENRLVLLWIEGVSLRIHRRGNWTKEVLGKHVDDSGIHGLRDDLTVLGDIIKQLMQGQTLDLLGLHVSTGVVEVKDDVALIEFLHKELLATIGWHLVKAWQLLQITLSLI